MKMPLEAAAPVTDVFRKAYRSLNPDEVQAMQLIKEQAGYLYGMLGDGKQVLVRTSVPVTLTTPLGYEDHLVNTDPRAIAIAKTKLEEAVMWATKAITG